MLTTTAERLEGNLVKLTVTVPAADVDAAIASTYKRLSSKMRIPGFRPGKAPRPVLDNMLGKDYVLHEATEEVVNTSYPAALDAELLRPIESPEVEDLDSIEPGKDYTYSAEIEVRPELTLSSADDFSVVLPSREATQKEIDLQLEASRERFATLEPVEDRGVEAEDFVLISFTGTVDGEGYEGNEVDKYLYEMNRGLMPDEFDAGIMGMKPGEERHIEFDIPDTSSNPEFVGKKAGFDVTVHEIKAKKLPEVDADFASNVGGFDSVEEMVADLKKRIDVQKSQSYDRTKERAVREQLAMRLEGEVPESMVVSRQSTMMRDFLQMLESRGMDIARYLEATGVGMDVLEADIAAQAAQSVREELALEALFRAKGMEVTDADLDEELATIATATETSPEEARKRWEELGLMAVVFEQITHRKASEWLLDNVTVTEETEDEADAPVEGTKKAAPKKKAAAKKKADKAEDTEAAEKTEE